MYISSRIVRGRDDAHPRRPRTRYNLILEVPIYIGYIIYANSTNRDADRHWDNSLFAEVAHDAIWFFESKLRVCQ